jgi:hypothetical protein
VISARISAMAEDRMRHQRFLLYLRMPS